MVTWLFYKFHTLWFYHRIYQSLQRLVLYTDSYYTGIYNAYDTLTDGTVPSSARLQNVSTRVPPILYYKFILRIRCFKISLWKPELVCTFFGFWHSPRTMPHRLGLTLNQYGRRVPVLLNIFIQPEIIWKTIWQETCFNVCPGWPCDVSFKCTNNCTEQMYTHLNNIGRIMYAQLYRANLHTVLNLALAVLEWRPIYWAPVLNLVHVPIQNT